MLKRNLSRLIKACDHLVKTLVLPNLVYGLSIYGASEAELTTVQCFLDQCFKCNYISHYADIRELLEKQDKIICNKVSKSEGHPLYQMLPKAKETSYQLRRRSSPKPRINTQRFISTFINHLIFRCN